MVARASFCTRHSAHARRARRAFSLLEVMVAIAILGLTLTVILSAQGGLAASNRSAANMGQAVHLGRCKMTETEERLLKLGFPEIEQIDLAVTCCENATPEGFTCDLKVEKIELPNYQGGGKDGGLPLPGASGSGIPGMPPIPGLTGSGGAPPINLDGGLQGIGASLGQMGGPGGMGAEGMLSMVMGILYPSLKLMYEVAIRKVSVVVKWKEGPNERELALTQYLTNPQRGGFGQNALLPDGGGLEVPGLTPSGSAVPGAAPAGVGTTPGAGGTTPGLGGGGFR